jgi:ribosomal protein S18 acetylase RimI-like enzyme
MVVREVRLDEPHLVRDFVDFPWQIYSGDPLWVPPLRRQIRRTIDPRCNPFLAYARLAAFSAYEDRGQMLGRIAAILNPLHWQMHGVRAGFFGLFESVNSAEVAGELLNAAKVWLQRAGCTEVIGPANLSTNDETGLLLSGRGEPPTVMCNYCPLYYHALMEGCGLTKATDTLAYESGSDPSLPTKYARVRQRAAANCAITLRRFSKAGAQGDIAEIRTIYNAAFANTWGSVPLSAGEADLLARDMMAFVDEDLVWLARHQGRPAGFILGLPDLNQVLARMNGRLSLVSLLSLPFRRRRITAMRIIAFAVVPECRRLGIESLLIQRVRERVRARPYARCEFSVVMETNAPMRHLLVGLGFRECKRYRIYRGPIQQGATAAPGADRCRMAVPESCS